MLREGRFPLALHALVEYLAGPLLIVAPWLFSFDGNGAATAVSIVLGVAVLAIAATTDWRPAVMRAIPLTVHLGLDLALAVVLIAAPFLFGYSDETGATAFFITLGVVHLLLTFGTRFRPPKESAGGTSGEADRGRRFGRGRSAKSGTSSSTTGGGGA